MASIYSKVKQKCSQSHPSHSAPLSTLRINQHYQLASRTKKVLPFITLAEFKTFGFFTF